MTWMDEEGNIHCIAGDTFDLNLTDIKEDGVLIDWTGWHANLKVKSNAIDKTSVLEFTETTGIDFSIPGAIRILRAAVDMKIISKTYFFDWVFIRPTNEVETWFNNLKFFAE